MRKSFLTLLVCFNSFFGFSQEFVFKQTLIPLDNLNGVPFTKDKDLNDLLIDGFEVDNNGNFYFCGGEKTAVIAVFSGNKQIYRKRYNEFVPGKLYIYNNKLYTFNYYDKNDLIVLNPIDGSFIKKYNHISSKNIGFYTFVDSSLITRTLKTSDDLFEQYTLTGKYVKEVSNLYNLPSSIIPVNDSNYELIGKWNDYFIFWDLIRDNNDSQIQKFWLINKEGEVLATKSLVNKNNIFGRVYIENPPEHRKVRNGNH